LDIYINEPPLTRTLSCLYDRICNGWPEGKKKPEENAMSVWLQRMSASTAFDGVIAGSANAIRQTGAETYGNILVSVRQYLQWLRLPEVRRVCASGSLKTETDVSLEELVSGSLVLYVCAPAGDLRGPLSGWFRLLTTLSLYIFEVLNTRLRFPTLFLLDEFPALGPLQSVESASGLMRSMSVRLVIIAQDIGQLRIYNNPETFLGFTCLYMGSSHQETLRHIEQTAGFKTVRREVKGVNEQLGKDRVEMLTEPVIRADDAKQIMGRGNIIVVLPENRSFITKRTRYFDFLPVCFYDVDRGFKERMLRGLMRHFFVGVLRFIRARKLKL
jgi:type IV secretory pathway TraG/TraD family ATPase VirD4